MTEKQDKFQNQILEDLIKRMQEEGIAPWEAPFRTLNQMFNPQNATEERDGIYRKVLFL